jgi:hypothetical protein
MVIVHIVYINESPSYETNSIYMIWYDFATRFLLRGYCIECQQTPLSHTMCVCFCVFVCVRERESVCLCVCVCVCLSVYSI